MKRQRAPACDITRNGCACPIFAIVPDSDFPLVNGEKGILIFDLAKRSENRKKAAYR